MPRCGNETDHALQNIIGDSITTAENGTTRAKSILIIYDDVEKVYAGIRQKSDAR